MNVDAVDDDDDIAVFLTLRNKRRVVNLENERENKMNEICVRSRDCRK